MSLPSSSLRRVLMISPHFPPDPTAATHRVRLLAPHLPEFGWEPTVLTVDPRDYEGALDPELADLVPEELEVVRCRALQARWTRRLGIGDLGLRAFRGLGAQARRLLETRRYDALFITIYPTYPALLGPRLKKRFGVPFVLDYQDPWVGAWGQEVGGGPGGAVDWKSRCSRRLSTFLEPKIVAAADGLTAVSSRTFEDVFERYTHLPRKPAAAIPLGGELKDFQVVRSARQANGFFEPTDGDCHLCYVGTLLPLGVETLEALLAAVGKLGQDHPALYARLKLHFFGTSNQTTRRTEERVLPIARRLGVADRIQEHPARIPYLDALRVLTQATAILMMGSSERHYTASKLYPGIMARRPLLAIYHQESSVSQLVAQAGQPPSARLVTYNDTERAGDRVDELTDHLAELVANPTYRPSDVDEEAVAQFSAQAMAQRLAQLLDQVAVPSVLPEVLPEARPGVTP